VGVVVIGRKTPEERVGAIGDQKYGG